MQVIEIANCAEKLFKENEFQKNNIKQFHLSWCHEEYVGNVFDFKFLDNDGNKFINPNKNLSNFASNFVSLGDFNINFINGTFQKGKDFILETDNTLKEQLLNLLLASELKKIVDYNELEMKVKSSCQTVIKRNKI